MARSLGREHHQILMDYQSRQTRWQVPRGVRPDVVEDDAFIVIRDVELLHKTYYMDAIIDLAVREQMRLRIILPQDGKLHSCLASALRASKLKFTVEKKLRGG